MKAEKKRIWLALALLVVVAVTGGLLWWNAHRPPPQIVTLPDGEKWQLAGVTYGTNHSWGTPVARLFHRLPASVENRIHKILGTRLSQIQSEATDTPSMGVWLQLVGTNGRPSATGPSGIVGLKLADEQGRVAGFRHLGFSSYAWTPNAFDFANFRVVPRRSPVLQVCFYDLGDQYPKLVAKMQFPNPLYRRYPEWKAEPLPAMKKAGGLEVRLDRFQTAYEDFTASADLHPARPGEDESTYFDISLNSPPGTNGEWVVQGAELSDATGNVLGFNRQVACLSLYALAPVSFPGQYQLLVGGTLWPDESAWRLKLTLKQTAGFAPEQFVTFKHVPVPKIGAGSTVNLTNVVGDVKFVLKQFTRNEPSDVGEIIIAPTELTIKFPDPPEDLEFDFVKLTTDSGEQPQLKYQNWEPDYHSYAIHLEAISSNAQTADITCVMQKTRSVEFLVKPPAPKPKAD